MISGLVLTEQPEIPEGVLSLLYEGIEGRNSGAGVSVSGIGATWMKASRFRLNRDICRITLIPAGWTNQITILPSVAVPHLRVPLAH
jgi:hypothetical protein